MHSKSSRKVCFLKKQVVNTNHVWVHKHSTILKQVYHSFYFILTQNFNFFFKSKFHKKNKITIHL
jgi:hypothetical protein